MATFSTALVPDVLKEAVREARKRVVVNKLAFDALDFRSKLTSFTISGDLTNRSIGQVNQMINSAILRGDSFKDFKKALPLSIPKITSPEVVWSNAVNHAYHSGRNRAARDLQATRPFLQYITFGDDQVRPNHAAMDGIVARQDDSFWSRNYPPNGHRCRCVARPLSARSAQRRGLDVETDRQATSRKIRETGVVPNADKGWEGRPEVKDSVDPNVIKNLTKFNPKQMNSVIDTIADILRGRTPAPVTKEAAKVGSLFSDYQEANIDSQLAKDQATGLQVLKDFANRESFHIKPLPDRQAIADVNFYQSYTKKRILGDKSLVAKMEIAGPLVKSPLVVFRDFLQNEKDRTSTHVEYFMNFIGDQLAILRVQRNIMAKLDLISANELSRIGSIVSGFLIFKKAG